MKRSEINALMRESLAFFRSCGFSLPPFAAWSPDTWRRMGPEADEIRDCRLGWDLTDFGLGDFAKTGLLIFTIRNGHPKDRRYLKGYCEKIMIVNEEQVTPMHFHWQKCEDIIVRGGGNLMVQLYNADAKEGLADTPVCFSTDGVGRSVKAGEIVRLTPGESITIPHHLYHDFTVEPGTGPVLLGEVSMCNDDVNDNRFYEPLGRFSTIEEDEPPYRLLCNEYPPAE